MTKDKIFGFLAGVMIVSVTIFIIAPCIHHLLFWIFNSITGDHVPV